MPANEKFSLITHRYSTPATLESREALRCGARFGADPAASTGRKVALNPVMRVDYLLPVSVGSTVLAVVEGVVLTTSMSIVSAHFEGEEGRREEEGREVGVMHWTTVTL